MKNKIKFTTTIEERGYNTWANFDMTGGKDYISIMELVEGDYISILGSFETGEGLDETEDFLKTYASESFGNGDGFGYEDRSGYGSGKSNGFSYANCKSENYLLRDWYL